MYRRGVRALVLLSLTVALLGAACQDEDPQEAQAAAEEELCQDLAALDSAIASAKNLSASSTVDQAQDARDAIRNAWDDVQEDAQDLTEVKVDQLRSAYESAGSTFDQASGNQTIGAVATTLQQRLQEVQQAQINLRTQAGCQ